MSDDKVATPKLEGDGSNWGTYHDRMHLILRLCKMGDHLTSATLTATYTTQWPAIAAGALQAHWEANEITAMSLIASSLPDTVFSLVKNQNTVFAQWEALKKKYNTHSSNHRFDLRSKLMNTHCLEGGNVHETFDQLAIIQQQLALAGVNIGDNEFASVLRNSLPKSYESIIPAITAVGETKTITSDVVTKFTLEAYDRKVAMGEVTTETIAFATSGGKESKKRKASDQGTGGGNGWHGQQMNGWRGESSGHTRGGQGRGEATGRSHEPPVCWNCRKPGHIEAWCRAPRGGHTGHTGGGSDERQSKRCKHDGGKKAKTTAHVVEDKESKSDDEDEEEEEDDNNKAKVNVLQKWVMVTTAGTAMDKATKSDLYDSGASRHISPFQEQFLMYQNIPNHPITAANNRTFNAIGKGDIAVDVPHGLTSRRIVLKDALFTPRVQLTIISISCLMESGYEAQFKEGRCIIKRGGDVIGSVPVSKNGLFKTRHAYALTAHNSSELINLPTLHRRLGHLVPKSICTLMNAHSVTGLRLIDDLSPFTCDSCDWAKMTRKRIRKHRITPQATHFGAEVHSDIWGPSVIKSINNRSYYVSFTNDYSHYSLMAFLHTKDENLKAYKSYAAWVQTQHGVPIQHLRSDQGGE